MDCIAGLRRLGALRGAGIGPGGAGGVTGPVKGDVAGAIGGVTWGRQAADLNLYPTPHMVSFSKEACVGVHAYLIA